MDGTRFDQVVRTLSTAAGRRTTLKLLGAALLGGGLGWQVVAAQGGDVTVERCRPEGRKCNPAGGGRKSCRRCCTNIGAADVYFGTGPTGTRCACRPDGNEGCANSSQCCSGVCDSGTCIGDSCLPNGATCQDPGECCSGQCTDSVCAGGGPNPECSGATCATFRQCGAGGDCVCFTTSEGGGFCATGTNPCAGLTLCPNGQSDCPADTICIVQSCCGDPVCQPTEFGCASAERSTKRSATKRSRKTRNEGPTPAHR